VSADDRGPPKPQAERRLGLFVLDFCASGTGAAAMMNMHSEFFAFLGGLSNGQALQQAYRRYKAADDRYCFEFNAALKGFYPLDDELTEHLGLMCRLIRAHSKSPLTLYRMTSVHDFCGDLLPAIKRESFTYRAFLSTSNRTDRLHSFQPGEGREPLVLKLQVPAGTALALMEAHEGAAEDEFLLGCGTRLRTIGEPTYVVGDAATEYLGYGSRHAGCHLLEVRVESNPVYVRELDFEFS
jgi:hypothetical protein